MTAKKSDCLEILSELEKSHDVVERFSVFETTSWICVKNLIFDRSLSDISFATVAGKSFLSIKTLQLIGLSAWSYATKIFQRKPQNIFIGAGSGVFKHKGKYLDSYLPIELSSEPGVPAKDTFYWITANHLANMWNQKRYLRQNRAVVSSLLVTPLRIILGHLIVVFLPYNRRILDAAEHVSCQLLVAGVRIARKDILGMHARFCAGYLIYRIFLFPFKIKRAYVVSAYSNSEVCAVLKKMGVEVTEIQHGIIGAFHRGYNYAVHTPLLPTPDIVNVYDDFWKRELIEAGFFSADQIIVSQRLKYLLANAEKRVFDFPYVVFTGQGILSDEIIKFINNLMAADSSIGLVYVPHPNEDADYISRIVEMTKNPRVHFVINTAITTEKLIMDSLAHLSVNSSCHFDAVHYKGETFILNLIRDNIMNDYVIKFPKSFIPVSNANEFIKYMENRS